LLLDLDDAVDAYGLPTFLSVIESLIHCGIFRTPLRNFTQGRIAEEKDEWHLFVYPP
jgi:hypothetical protein